MRGAVGPGAGFVFVGALAAALFVTGVATFWSFTADDAYIVARYAENWVDSGALEYNLGERILAVTSPLHLGLAAALHALTGSTLPSYKVVALLSLLGALGLTWRALGPDAIGRTVVLVVVLLSPCVLIWTFGGLETPLLLLLATILALLGGGAGTGERVPLEAIFFVAGLCFVTRYDAALYAAPLVAHAAVRCRRPPVRIARAALIGALIPVSWLSFAWLYYGDPLATSYYVKMPAADDLTVGRNAAYIAAYLTVTGALPLALWRWAEAGRAAGRALRAHLRDAWGLYLAVAAMLGYGLWVATVHMMFGFRYFVPYLPAVALLIAGFGSRIDALERGPRPGRRTRFAVLGLVLIAFQGYQIHRTRTHSMDGIVSGAEYAATGTRGYQLGMMAARRASAEEIREHWRTVGRDRPPRIFTTAGGLLPYAYREAYILERLVSYRRRCEMERAALARYADYVHFISPRHGRVNRRLPRPLRHYQLVSSSYVVYDGVLETVLTYHDPSPPENPLPATIGGRCGEG